MSVDKDMQYDPSPAEIVRDFKRRKLPPEKIAAVDEGVLRLWQLNNSCVAELSLNSSSQNKYEPGTLLLRGGCFINTYSAQEIATFLMEEQDKLSLATITATPL